jgi:hypothetical protein
VTYGTRLRGEEHGRCTRQGRGCHGRGRGIGKGIPGALLDDGVKVVIADVEKSALDAVVLELSRLGVPIGTGFRDGDGH